MFAAGAGRLGNYRRCAWEALGTGQFEAMEGSNPFSGSRGELHQEEEWRIEMLCPDDRVRSVVDALKEAHPYEEPAFDLFATLDLEMLE